MSGWIVPLAGFLVFLFFCPGCFLWVWLYNRRFDSRRWDESAIKAGRPSVPVRRNEMILVFPMFPGIVSNAPYAPRSEEGRAS
jgi:hypothetical protein